MNANFGAPAIYHLHIGTNQDHPGNIATFTSSMPFPAYQAGNRIIVKPDNADEDAPTPTKPYCILGVDYTIKQSSDGSGCMIHRTFITVYLTAVSVSYP